MTSYYVDHLHHQLRVRDRPISRPFHLLKQNEIEGSLPVGMSWTQWATNYNHDIQLCTAPPSSRHPNLHARRQRWSAAAVAEIRKDPGQHCPVELGQHLRVPGRNCQLIFYGYNGGSTSSVVISNRRQFYVDPYRTRVDPCDAMRPGRPRLHSS
ncbi:hypothetical protein DAPPUDRAFT_111682 [Daphnia pulex]|uniref:Uncharacterized protein n=1 Tax=Daphnia pulex TaxID=6669 RepID=E9H9Z2_DAPPU|nr:hypothetical protein DAPPUDRAFT_111682 [Daphnia pulex]|eukprot:EFX71488.1 hypothetical protein DAPPUDRAFT_111682 [Daphnia pulex]